MWAKCLDNDACISSSGNTLKSSRFICKDKLSGCLTLHLPMRDELRRLLLSVSYKRVYFFRF